MRHSRFVYARRLGVVLLAAALAACGGGEEDGAPPAGAAPSSTEAASVPPGTDVWLARLVRDAQGGLTLAEPRNVTNRPGYDNQPAFLPDGSGFYYTVIDEAGQADTWFWDLREEAARRITSTAPESEYSPTPLPMGGGFSVVRVEADSTQRLWRFASDGTAPSVLLEGVAPVGYHAWIDADQVALFVLGDPPTLQVARISDGVATQVASGIGQGLQRIPGERDVSWVQRLPDGTTEIRRLDAATGTSEPIAPGVDGADFHAWTPDGVLLQASGARLFAFMPGSPEGWREIADLGALGVRLSRLAVHPDGTWIALVAAAPEGG